MRPRVAAIAERYGARVAVAEVPPGPPVLQTLVAEIYGPDRGRAAASSRERSKTIFKQTPGVVDVDWYIEADQPKARFVIDKEKAALHGISAETISQTLRIAVGGESVDLLHLPREKEDVNIVLELPRSLRDHAEELLALRVRSGDANALPEPGARPGPAARAAARTGARSRTTRSTRSHLPQEPDARDLRHRRCGRRRSKARSMPSSKMNEALRKLDTREFGGDGAELKILNATMPFTDAEPVDEMGRRMAHHHRGLPRSRRGLRRRV